MAPLNHLARPVDSAGLGLFRALFGALMLIAVLRYAANGWIQGQLTAPLFHFTWPHLDWIRPLPGVGTHLVFALMALTALALALGVFARPAALLFALLFTYVELIDIANYLNHYYLVSLIALLLAATPSDRAFALAPSFRRPRPSPHSTIPAAAHHLLRAQFTLVWLHAGLAKLNPDWLLRAEPLRAWLAARADLPLIGPLLAAPPTAVIMSGAGAAFDLTIPFLLLHPRTRRPAFLLAAAFHLTVWALFPIGIFSPLMLLGATLFLPPDWPRRRPHPLPDTPHHLPRPALALAALYLTLQLLMPLRHHLYPGPVDWTEEGFRFAWRVMLIHKTGRAEFRVVTPERTRVVHPTEHLTALQHEQMVTQPDLMHAFAHELARRERAAGHPDVRVYADAWVSLNGRPARRIIDPTIDLAAEPRASFAPARYILPLTEADARPLD